MSPLSADWSLSRAAAVEQYLLTRIQSGEYPPGSYLVPQDQLAEQLGVSRTAIREGVRGLAAKGLLSIEQGRGTRVLAPNTDAIMSSVADWLEREPSAMSGLMHVRALFEVDAARLAAEHAELDDLQQLDALVLAMPGVLDDRDAYVDLDLEFHAMIARASGNVLLAALSIPINRVLRKGRILGWRGRPAADRSADEHRRIYLAIKRRRGAWAAREMRAHIQRAQQDAESAALNDAEVVA